MSYYPGGGKSKIKLLVDLVYAEGLLPASWTAMLLCLQDGKWGGGSPDSLQEGS